MTLFDVVVLAVVGLSALVGLTRGAVSEILGLASWIGAAIVAYLALPYARPLVEPAVGAGGLADLVAIAGAFLVALIAFKLVAGMITRAVSGSAVGPLDKLLGLAFGAARGAVLVCLGFLVASQFMRPNSEPVWVRDAMLIGPVRDGSARLAAFLPEPAPGEPGPIAPQAPGNDGRSVEQIQQPTGQPAPER